MEPTRDDAASSQGAKSDLGGGGYSPIFTDDLCTQAYPREDKVEAMNTDDLETQAYDDGVPM